MRSAPAKRKTDSRFPPRLTAPDRPPPGDPRHRRKCLPAPSTRAKKSVLSWLTFLSTPLPACIAPGMSIGNAPPRCSTATGARARPTSSVSRLSPPASRRSRSSSPSASSRRWSPTTTSSSANISRMAAVFIPQRDEQSRFLASTGALLLVANFMVTAALSGWAAVSYLGFPPRHAQVATMVLVLIVGAINFFGPKHSGSVSLWLALPAVVVVILIVVFSAPASHHRSSRAAPAPICNIPGSPSSASSSRSAAWKRSRTSPA